MKRIFISLLTVIACSMAAMAQDSRVATLQHGTNIKAYYGPDALVEAHKGAVEGDLITLSAGQFNCPEISKAITIRGEGMDKTEIANYNPTIFTIPGGSSYPLSLEGLTVRPTSSYGTSISGTTGTETVLISKCRFFAGYYNSRLNFSKCDAVIIQSIIQQGDYAIWAGEKANVTCINSVLRGVEGTQTGKYDLQNCFIEGKFKGVAYSSIKNCIVSEVCTLDETNTTSHCLVKEGSAGFEDSWYIMTTAPDPGPWEDPEAVVVWDNLFTGNYHLTDEASQTYIGTNGTEVGVYGGTYPYEKTPDYPVVKSLDVIGSHKDGKLNVQINVE